MKKYFATGILVIVSFSALFIWQYFQFNDGRLHVVFCNVGQGDAIFLRTPDKTDILVDGGPDRSVLECLDRHMPFWDKKLELVILSHPHEDHFAGLMAVFASYDVQTIATEPLVNESAGYDEFMTTLKAARMEPRYLLSGDTMKSPDGVVFKVIAPSKSFLEKTSPRGKIGESGEFGSLVIRVDYGQFSLLLTSDSQAGQLQDNLAAIDSVDVLQVPHHGSKTGLTKDIIDILDSQLAVISVGKNRYGHPHKETMGILSEKDIKIFRTDKEGEIEIISDGKSYFIKSGS